MKRRSFVGKTLIGGFAALVAPKVLSANENKSFSKIHTPPKGPVLICTWSFTAANAAAAKALESGSDALTAAIKAAEVEELNAQNTTVGLWWSSRSRRNRYTRCFCYGSYGKLWFCSCC